MSELRCLHEGTVTPDQIDHLGHMNVRFYAVRAGEATRALAAEFGLGPEACAEQGLLPAVSEQFTRHYREQLEGARLGVHTGVLAARERGLRIYHELRNQDTGERSATFVHELELQDLATRERRPFPAGLAEVAQSKAVQWPAHGQPRTIDLDAATATLGLDGARERELAIRKPRVLAPGECDADGCFRGAFLPELVWGGEPLQPRGGPALHQTASGIQMGWATLESHCRLLRTPRVGSRLQSFGADVEIASKTSLQCFWVFDLDDGGLVSTFSVVNLAFDVGGRRAMEIPPEIRRELEARHHPDLRPRPAAGV